MPFFFVPSSHFMGSSSCLALSLMIFVILPNLSISGPARYGSISPNFTASYFQYIDQTGIFLVSPGRNFQASISNLKEDNSKYYVAIFHVPSNTRVWTANRNNPISSSDTLILTSRGLSITNASSTVWYAQLNPGSAVSLLQLRDSGNLVLLDKNNLSLWESFDNPTDTILPGQRLSVGYPLYGAVKEDDDMAEGAYSLVVSSTDAVLQWNQQNYWKLSMYPGASKDSNDLVSFLSVNGTGVFLYANGGSRVVFRWVLDPVDLRIAKLGSNGKFSIMKYENSNWVDEFHSPENDCGIPSICRPMALCSPGICSCPPNFHNDPHANGTCTPTNASLSLPSSYSQGACTLTLVNSSSSISYVRLGLGVDYFANDFMIPARQDVNLSSCQELCSQNCSCLAVFLSASGSCYLLEDQLGSFMSVSGSSSDRLGYVKAIAVSSLKTPPANAFSSSRTFPLAGLVLLPSSGIFLLVILVLGLMYWKRTILPGTALTKFNRSDSNASDLEIALITGLPVRFSYGQLETATENFKTLIGSGGFGSVYKGTLPDKTVVAVKKINALGVRGKKEFCSEIAVIGKIHHINLVKLRGFCAQGRLMFLVFEYMNRGSLDRELFDSNEAVLEWEHRLKVALGTARGLAYLHSGCEHKIIHCDVKPENILLHGNLQVKISDFGLSKLLTPEQSSLFTTLRGTRGYLAPEWLTGSTISDKADVYSYGMVLLEIVKGRKNSYTQKHSHEEDGNHQTRPASKSPRGLGSRNVYFPLQALEMHEKRRYLELADSRLQQRVTNEDVEKLVRVALCCLHEDPALRPSMANVVGMLEGAVPLGEPQLKSLNFLRFYGRRFNEESTVGRSDEQNEFVLFPARDALSTTNATSESCNSLSYISSQQVSGPR